MNHKPPVATEYSERIKFTYLCQMSFYSLQVCTKHLLCNFSKDQPQLDKVGQSGVFFHSFKMHRSTTGCSLYASQLFICKKTKTNNAGESSTATTTTTSYPRTTCDPRHHYAPCGWPSALRGAQLEEWVCLSDD